MPLSILVVDDDAITRDLVAALLHARDHDVETAEDGFAALRLLQDKRFDLVFVDYHLPEMDGYAFARMVRSLGEVHGPGLKMVALTADRSGLMGRRGVDAIFDHVLPKPIGAEALYACIEGVRRPSLPVADSVIDAFFDDTPEDEPRAAARRLWIGRGLAARPKAAVFPATTTQRGNLACCFDLVDPIDADCLILADDEGLEGLAEWRECGDRFLQPLFALQSRCAEIADAIFDVRDADSWTNVAKRLRTFEERTAKLAANPLDDGPRSALRFLAYLYAADRRAIVRRMPAGSTSAIQTGGFAPASIVDAVRELGQRGWISAVTQTAADGVRELVVGLSQRGLDRLEVRAPAETDIEIIRFDARQRAATPA